MSGDGTIRWQELLGEAASRLAAAGVAAAAGEARRIVETAAGCDDGNWLEVLEAPATHRGAAAFDTMLARRASGEPLQYVLGSWGFRTLDLFVDNRVLIPRPETEILVGLCLDELARRAAARAAAPVSAPVSAAPASSGLAAGSGCPPALAPLSGQGIDGGIGEGIDGGIIEPGMLLAVDLGCGSGAIGLSLVAERADVAVVCTDVSADALAVAGANLAGLGRPARRVRLAEGSWFEALPPEFAGRLDLIAANPPYIGHHEPLAPEVDAYEPPVALRSGPTGLEATATIVSGAPHWLAPGGAIVVEMADGSAGRVRELAAGVGLVDLAVHRDLAGCERVLVARKPS